MNFFATASETDLFPLQDPEVIRLQALCDAATVAAEPALKAWKGYLTQHWEDSVRVPWPKEKAALSDAADAAQQAADAAGAALDLALTAATERAQAVWNDRIRQAFRDDQPTIEAFIAVLERHEATAVEAQAAGVPHILKVPVVFMTSTEVAGRWAYAKKALGLD